MYRNVCFKACLLVVSMLMGNGAFSQGKVDYLDYNYKYLDKNHKIKIDTATYDAAIKKYKFFPDRIKTYSDSLSVIMMLEFNDWEKARIATRVVCFSWLRLSYYTLKSKEEIKSYSESFGIRHPYLFYEFLKDESNDNPSVANFFDELKKKIVALDNSQNVKGLTRNKLLSLALRLSPSRQKDQEEKNKTLKYQTLEYELRHGKVDPNKIGVGCEKKDCCQKKKS